jgi:uncharacterized membrane protein
MPSAASIRWAVCGQGEQLVDAEGPAPHQPPPNEVEALALLVCFGTEPHRAFRLGSDGTATYVTSSPEGPTSLRATKLVTDRQGNPDAFDLLDIRGKQWLSVVVAKTGKCSDGMDRLLAD